MYIHSLCTLQGSKPEDLENHCRHLLRLIGHSQYKIEHHQSNRRREELCVQREEDT